MPPPGEDGVCHRRREVDRDVSVAIAGVGAGQCVSRRAWRRRTHLGDGATETSEHARDLRDARRGDIRVRRDGERGERTASSDPGTRIRRGLGPIVGGQVVEGVLAGLGSAERDRQEVTVATGEVEPRETDPVRERVALSIVRLVGVHVPVLPLGSRALEGGPELTVGALVEVGGLGRIGERHAGHRRCVPVTGPPCRIGPPLVAALDTVELVGVREVSRGVRRDQVPSRRERAIAVDDRPVRPEDRERVGRGRIEPGAGELDGLLG